MNGLLLNGGWGRMGSAEAEAGALAKQCLEVLLAHEGLALLPPTAESSWSTAMPWKRALVDGVADLISAGAIDQPANGNYDVNHAAVESKVAALKARNELRIAYCQNKGSSQQIRNAVQADPKYILATRIRHSTLQRPLFERMKEQADGYELVECASLRTAVQKDGESEYFRVDVGLYENKTDCRT